jgi:hypothetical protein
LVLLVSVLAGGGQERANTSGPLVAPPETPSERATVEPRTPQLPLSATSKPAGLDPELPKACNVGDDLCACCPSGRTCGPGGCGAVLQPGEQFDLRLWTVHRKPGVATAAADRVCVARATDPVTSVCSKVGETYGGALPAALLVSTRDLTETGLVIQITAGGRMVERGNAKHGLIFRAAICDGLTFGGFGDADEPNRRVTFYLDERGKPARRSCVLDRRGGVLSRKDRDVTLTPREWSSKCFEHVNSGYFAWAKTACVKARAESDPSLPESSLYYNLGLVERGFGNRAAAREYFSKSLELKPHAEVQAALNALDAR